MIYTIDQIRNIVSPIAAAYGVKSVSLFGSYARGEASEESDVDLLLDRSGMEGGWIIGGLYMDLQDALHKELDLVTVNGADSAFLERIRKDAIRIYERDEERAG